MFYHKNREALRRYVDKTRDFDAEAVFFENKLFIIQRTLKTDEKLEGELKVVCANLNQYLDMHEDFNNDTEEL